MINSSPRQKQKRVLEDRIKVSNKIPFPTAASAGWQKLRLKMENGTVGRSVW